MAKSSTLMKALLGMAVVAGWQNRDKIGEYVKQMGNQTNAPGGNPSGGLADLIEQFKKSGLGEKADSWVGTGENKPITEPEVAQSVGKDALDDLATQTGLSREDLLKRLSAVLPELVDKMTPEGKLPA